MAAMMWHCPRCQQVSSREGTCTRCRTLYVADEPPVTEADRPDRPDRDTDLAPEPGTATAAEPGERLALRMPWRQQINLPDDGQLVLGRSSPEFRAHPQAVAADQVSRAHARFFRDERGDLWVEDLNSANGTYIDGVPVAACPSRLRSGQVLRFAQDVECPVLRLDDYGEPVGGNDRDDRQS